MANLILHHFSLMLCSGDGRIVPSHNNGEELNSIRMKQIQIIWQSLWKIYNVVIKLRVAKIQSGTGGLLRYLK